MIYTRQKKPVLILKLCYVYLYLTVLSSKKILYILCFMHNHLFILDEKAVLTPLQNMLCILCLCINIDYT